MKITRGIGVGFRPWASVLTLWAAACTPGGTPGVIQTFQMDFQCSSEQVELCDVRSIDRTVYFALAPQGSSPCATLFNISGSVQLHLYFDYYSSTLVQSYGADQVWGRFSTYFDRDQETVDSFAPGAYQACAFIDQNANGFLDPGEPLMSVESWSPSLDLARNFTQWSSAP